MLSLYIESTDSMIMNFFVGLLFTDTPGKKEKTSESMCETHSTCVSALGRQDMFIVHSFVENWFHVSNVI